MTGAWQDGGIALTPTMWEMSGTCRSWVVEVRIPAVIALVYGGSMVARWIKAPAVVDDFGDLVVVGAFA